MKTLTVKNPWAYLICSGLKDIENRTWRTKFRGRILIHVGLHEDVRWFDRVDENLASIIQDGVCRNLTKKEYEKQGGFIIGSVEIVDCRINHPSIWAENTDLPYLADVLEDIHNLGKAMKPDNLIYNWVLANPILFSEPIEAKGKLSLWEYDGLIKEDQ